MTPPRPLRTLALLLGLVAASAGHAAPPDPPEQLSYQGVLLDDLGQPRTGSVDLTVRLFDSLLGGTKLYTETLTAVALTDGVFAVQIGPAGLAVDPPTHPLTTSLADALIGDLVAVGPDRFLEVTVGTESPLGRTQVLTVPYALRAEEAGHASSADVAVTATTATTATSIGGVAESFITELFEHGNSDDSGPDNDDPSEGLGDADLDGIANFIDPDNDDDGLDDSQEVAQGSDINLVTPVVDSASPSSGLAGVAQDVRVEGSNFAAGLSVAFGSELPAPTGITATGFDVRVGPQPLGFADITVTLANGESDLLSAGFEFVTLETSVATDADTHLSFRVIDDQRTLVGGIDQYAVDTVLYAYPTAESSGAAPGQLAVAWNPAGALVGLRCRDTGPDDCDVEIAVDTDADFDLLDETAVVLQSLTQAARSRLTSPSLAFDSAGRTIAVYRVNTIGNDAVVAHDRDGDGQFGGTNELVVVDTVTGNDTRLGAAAFDPGTGAAHVYHDKIDDSIDVAWDRNGDGDFGDTVSSNPEFAAVVSSVPGLDCLGAAFASDGDLVFVYDDGSSGLVLARDLNSDGDFVDAGETTTLDAGAGQACDVVGGAGESLAIGAIAGSSVRLWIDRNDDGDFDDTDEVVDLAGVSGTGVRQLRVDHNDVGRVLVAITGTGDEGILADPN